MSVVGRLLTFAIAGAFALVLGAHSAWAAGSTTVARPTTGGQYGYTTPETAPYVGARAVIHYVTSGPDAPPLNDDNADGYPDYVEQVSQAADTALLYYERHGFKLPLADSGGPDAKPDIYIDALPAGVFGLTFPETAEGGTFVLVSPRLDSRNKTLGSLPITVAHELFHVIQFSYVVSGKLPLWAAEGSASAMSMLVFPKVEDVSMTSYLSSWLSETWLPLYDERLGCAHCYGGAWWWMYLARRSPGALPRYFALLEAADRQGKSTSIGVSQLDAALKSSHAGPLSDVFTNFSLDLYRRGLPLRATYSLSSSTTPRATSIRAVNGLSAQYVSVHVPSTARGVVVAVPFGDGPRPHITLVVGGPKGRRVVGARFRPGRGVILSTTFRSAAERRRIVLIVTSGHLEGVRYQVGYAAVGRGGKLPGWIAF
jgi:hypothetical protein